jgi:hypothetical protein
MYVGSLIPHLEDVKVKATPTAEENSLLNMCKSLQKNLFPSNMQACVFSAKFKGSFPLLDLHLF